MTIAFDLSLQPVLDFSTIPAPAMAPPQHYIDTSLDGAFTKADLNLGMAMHFVC